MPVAAMSRLYSGGDDLPIAPRPPVFLGDIERHRSRPRLLDEVSHLAGVDRIEADVDPVEAHVALTRQLELVRLRLDGGLSQLLREAAPHALAVLGQREPNDLADPELDPAVHEHLVAAGERLRDCSNFVRCDHVDPATEDRRCRSGDGWATDR